jgi:hypothetical protein
LTELGGAVIGAFVGSFSAFLFFLLGEALNKGYHRVSAGRNALVALERVLNEHLDAAHVSGNEAAQARLALSSGKFLGCLPRPFEMPDGLDRDLMDRESINRLFSLRLLLRRCNSDADNMRVVHDRLVALRLDGKLTRDAFIENAAPLAAAYEQLAQALHLQYTDEVQALLARVRVLLGRPRSRAVRFVGFLSRTFMVGPSNPPTTEEVARERAKLEAEVKASLSRAPSIEFPGAMSQEELQAAIAKTDAL